MPPDHDSDKVAKDGPDGPTRIPFRILRRMANGVRVAALRGMQLAKNRPTHDQFPPLRPLRNRPRPVVSPPKSRDQPLPKTS